jgi:hypothetical protein
MKLINVLSLIFTRITFLSTKSLFIDVRDGLF